MSWEPRKKPEMVHTQVNVTETTTADLTANAVLVTDAQILLRC